ncbi:MAG: virulence RhuM family protein [Paludibacteraceae bacterium]|nr:virulence RhuM family protein [Paludibacteraceae bacterium]
MFQSSRTNIVEHIRHIYEDGELAEDATCRKFRQIQQEGIRMVAREMPFYNLDVIISVGYRVNSKRAFFTRHYTYRLTVVWSIPNWCVTRLFLILLQQNVLDVLAKRRLAAFLEENLSKSTKSNRKPCTAAKFSLILQRETALSHISTTVFTSFPSGEERGETLHLPG